MTPHFAHVLLDRVEDARSQGDPKCRRCDGSGSYPVPDAGAHARCECQDKIDEADKLVGRERYLAAMTSRSGQ